MKLYNFLNDDGNKYKELMRSPVFVDKSGLIGVLNDLISQGIKYVCNSRPRRFGKSVTCNMIRAYYSKGIDSSNIFDDLQVSNHSKYKQFMNKYDVIHIDMAKFVTDPFLEKNNVIDIIATDIINELQDLYPNVIYKSKILRNVLEDIYTQTGNKFVFIIDEWDIIIREYSNNNELLNKYINFLRSLFKSDSANDYLVLAYLTGIMPIYKELHEFANFDEFTMIEPSKFAQYIGFTEDEVKILCNKYNFDFDEIKTWYYGYKLEKYDIYNPYAVVNSIMDQKFLNYWSATGSYEKINYLIENDFDGLKANIVSLIAGEKIFVDVTLFNNRIDKCKDKNDVLTCLIHLGYLAYDESNKKAYIPNKEIKHEFVNAMHVSKWTLYDQYMEDSSRLLEETYRLNGDFVAKQLESIHAKYQSIIEYNDENSLASTIELAYLYTLKKYERPIRELPTGKGFADIIYIPQKIFANYPALVIELKYNKNAQTAINQIKEKEYFDAIKDYVGDILLVGINYDKKTKEHTCIIEKLVKE